MNFLSHAMPYLTSPDIANPLVAVSTGIPDWLTVVDRRIRARGKLAEQHVNSPDPELGAVARGILLHIADDRWFHGTRAFAETNLELAIQLRDQLPGDAGFRPSFVGHILVEMLLDGLWIRDDRRHAENYYAAIRQTPASTIERCVNVITGKPTTKLKAVIERFVEIEFLYDYLDCEKLLMRLNQVMNRVKLPLLPDTIAGWLPEAQDLVESRRHQLLTPPGDTNHFPPIPVN